MTARGAKPREGEIVVPATYPSSTFFIDESGARASSGDFFVVAGIKIRRAGALRREIGAVREKCSFSSEFKLSSVTRGALVPYYEAVDALVASDAHIVATVVDTSVYDPFRSSKAEWRVHADVVARLIAGATNRRELVTVLVDAITTPQGKSFEDEVRRLARMKLRSGSVVTVTCLDSRSTDLLQMADLVAGAIRLDRRNEGVGSNSNKGKVVQRLRAALGVADLADQRSTRINIATLRARASSSGM